MTNKESAAAIDADTGNSGLTVALASYDRQSLLRRLALTPSTTLFVLMVVFVAFGLTRSPALAQGLTWVNILRDASFTAIVASFMAIVLIAGGLDLSVGSVYVAGAMLSAHLMATGLTPALAVLAGILLGAVVGVINGLLVTYLKIPPIITTLAMMFAVRSIVNALSLGNTISVPAGVAHLGQTKILGIPVTIYVAVVVCLIAHVLLSTTNLGWSIRATGGNETAARSAGLNVRRITITVYVMCGAAAALAGVMQSARLGSAPSNLGTGLELTVIAAAVIGGCSINGAIGSVFGAVLGATMISVLNYGLIVLKVDPNWQNFVIGMVLLTAAGLDQLRTRQQFRMSARRTAEANKQ